MSQKGQFLAFRMYLTPVLVLGSLSGIVGNLSARGADFGFISKRLLWAYYGGTTGGGISKWVPLWI
jgi:hypothetical protein